MQHDGLTCSIAAPQILPLLVQRTVFSNYKTIFHEFFTDFAVEKILESTILLKLY